MVDETRQVTGTLSLAKVDGESLTGAINPSQGLLWIISMNNNTPNRARRIAFMLSGGIDALIGTVLLGIGFGFVPVDVAPYGVQNWHVSLLGGVMFLLGAVTFAYNFSRLDE